MPESKELNSSGIIRLLIFTESMALPHNWCSTLFYTIFPLLTIIRISG